MIKYLVAILLISMVSQSWSAITSNASVIKADVVKGKYVFTLCENDGYEDMCEDIGSSEGYSPEELNRAAKYCSTLSRWNRPASIFLKMALGSGGFFIGMSVGVAVTSPTGPGAISGGAAGAAIGSSAGVAIADRIVHPIDTEKYKTALLFLKKIKKTESTNFDTRTLLDVTDGLSDCFERWESSKKFQKKIDPNNKQVFSL